jgi:hypothetical protein
MRTISADYEFINKEYILNSNVSMVLLDSLYTILFFCTFLVLLCCRRHILALQIVLHLTSISSPSCMLNSYITLSLNTFF